jgi:hypothetical protein
MAEDAIPDPTIRQAKAETVKSTLAACRRIEVFPRNSNLFVLGRARRENSSSSAVGKEPAQGEMLEVNYLSEQFH